MDAYTSDYQMEARALKQDFTPDGNIHKPAWKRARWAKFDHDWSGKRRYRQAETWVASAWTPGQFYLAYQCRYTKLNVISHGDPASDTWGLWEHDVVEAFLNADPEHVNHYYEFEVAPNNLWIDLEINLDRKPFNDAKWNSGYAHATRIGRGVWTCEMRIPVASLAGQGRALRAGDAWRGNFFRMDGPSGPLRRGLCWSPTLTHRMNFHVPTRFGTIRFVG